MRLIVVFILLLNIILFAQEPVVSVQSVNSPTVGLYEKFEIRVLLQNVTYSNPYNPGEVDLRTMFTAPSGRTWEIFGFYDNYNNANQWKVRFAPNETGTWTYRLQLDTPGGSAVSADSTFEVTLSGYHGWIRVSPFNPHYFIFDDGTPFYGVGPYYPWGVTNTSSGLGQLEATECNFWGYWNIPYDGGEIIESVNSGIGRYDQPKCGRIDQLITWSEERDLKMMLAIWPHDLLSNTVWAHQWHRNPYKNVCAVEVFFESEAAWQYQEHQYRYIIARWGYSRALAVWEIVNEVNGTDGWVAGNQDEARIWVGRVHDYLTANDPHQRPTTASMSGGQYWPAGYAEVDVPNVHVYETGWLAKYPANPLRSSAYTYFMLARQFWNDFQKPAIFGEAGYLDSYGNFAAGSEEYTAMFHNALWASWAGGMAATPVWWDFGSKQIMTGAVMEQMRTFSVIARDYNYAWQNFQPYEMSAARCDVYAMRSDGAIFGWVREEYGDEVKGHILQFEALGDTSYQIKWYNTWTAELIGSDFLVGSDSTSMITIPESADGIPDVAFFAEKTAEGETPAKIKLGTAAEKIYVKRDEQAQILCTIHDAEGRFVRKAGNNIQFLVEGPGHFIGSALVAASSGRAEITFTADSTSGKAVIIAESDGLQSDTLQIEILNRIRVDDFDSYDTLSDLAYIWYVRSGTTAEMSLTNSVTQASGSSLKVSYTIGEGSAPYAGIYCFNAEKLTAAEDLEWVIQGDTSGRTLAVLVNESNGRYWEYDYPISAAGTESVRVRLSDFEPSDTATVMNLEDVDEISFNILKGTGEFGSGILYLDDINFVIPAIETVIPDENLHSIPAQFQLLQNYPNPFNNTTTITYLLPRADRVTLEVFDSTGKVVDRLLNDAYQAGGTHRLQWRNPRASSGLYFYRITAGDYYAVRKCLLIK